MFRSIRQATPQQLPSDFLSLCISHKLWACSGSHLATTIEASEAADPRKRTINPTDNSQQLTVGLADGLA